MRGTSGLINAAFVLFLLVSLIYLYAHLSSLSLNVSNASVNEGVEKIRKENERVSATYDALSSGYLLMLSNEGKEHVTISKLVVVSSDAESPTVYDLNIELPPGSKVNYTLSTPMNGFKAAYVVSSRGNFFPLLRRSTYDVPINNGIVSAVSRTHLTVNTRHLSSLKSLTELFIPPEFLVFNITDRGALEYYQINISDNRVLAISHQSLLLKSGDMKATFLFKGFEEFGVVDQRCEASYTSYSQYYDLAQSFIVEQSGLLKDIRLGLIFTSGSTSCKFEWALVEANEIHYPRSIIASGSIKFGSQSSTSVVWVGVISGEMWGATNTITEIIRPTERPFLLSDSVYVIEYLRYSGIYWAYRENVDQDPYRRGVPLMYYEGTWQYDYSAYTSTSPWSSYYLKPFTFDYLFRIEIQRPTWYFFINGTFVKKVYGWPTFVGHNFLVLDKTAYFSNGTIKDYSGYRRISGDDEIFFVKKTSAVFENEPLYEIVYITVRGDVKKVYLKAPPRTNTHLTDLDAYKLMYLDFNLAENALLVGYCDLDFVNVLKGNLYRYVPDGGNMHLVKAHFSGSTVDGVPVYKISQGYFAYHDKYTVDDLNKWSLTGKVTSPFSFDSIYNFRLRGLFGWGINNAKWTTPGTYASTSTLLYTLPMSLNYTLLLDVGGFWYNNTYGHYDADYVLTVRVDSTNTVAIEFDASVGWGTDQRSYFNGIYVRVYASGAKVFDKYYSYYCYGSRGLDMVYLGRFYISRTNGAILIAFDHRRFNDYPRYSRTDNQLSGLITIAAANPQNAPFNLSLEVLNRTTIGQYAPTGGGLTTVSTFFLRSMVINYYHSGLFQYLDGYQDRSISSPFNSRILHNNDRLVVKCDYRDILASPWLLSATPITLNIDLLAGILVNPTAVDLNSVGIFVVKKGSASKVDSVSKLLVEKDSEVTLNGRVVVIKVFSGDRIDYYFYSAKEVVKNA